MYFTILQSLIDSFLTSEVECRNVSPICPDGDGLYGVKIVNLPRFAENGRGIAFDMVRLFISACTKCLTLGPLLGGGVTRKADVLSREEARSHPGNNPISPVFEVHE